MAKNLNLAIYSTFCGSSKNSTFNPAPVNENYAYYFISNNEKSLKKAKNSGWKAIFLDKEIYDDPTKSAYQAKFAKAMPHKFNELKKYEDDPYEKRAFLYLDIISWLESKIDRKPLQYIIKEKAILIIKEKDIIITNE